MTPIKQITLTLLAFLFAAFDSGDRKKGADTAMALWNRNIKQME